MNETSNKHYAKPDPYWEHQRRKQRKKAVLGELQRKAHLSRQR
jgi:hypothetical protein